MNSRYLIAIFVILFAFGCLQPNPNELHLICKGSSVCCMGFGNECATFKCSNNVYYSPGGMDAASVYVNGSSGEIIARCGGNIAPLHPELCRELQNTCDMTKGYDKDNGIPAVVLDPYEPTPDRNKENSSKQNQTLQRICHTSACCMGFDDQCATLKCANNVYARLGDGDAADVYLNGSNGDIIARCGGNIMPLHPELCSELEKTCDLSKTADSIPDVIRKIL